MSAICQEVPLFPSSPTPPGPSHWEVLSVLLPKSLLDAAISLPGATTLVQTNAYSLHTTHHSELILLLDLHFYYLSTLRIVLLEGKDFASLVRRGGVITQHKPSTVEVLRLFEPTDKCPSLEAPRFPFVPVDVLSLRSASSSQTLSHAPIILPGKDFPQPPIRLRESCSFLTVPCVCPSQSTDHTGLISVSPTKLETP